MNRQMFFNRSLEPLPQELSQLLGALPEEEKQYAQEIRLRINRPLSVVIRGESFFVTREGRACKEPDSGSFMVTQVLLEECFLRLCGYSVHSHQEEICRGYITAKNGDRVGLCASAVRGRDGTITYRDISSVNLRVSREAIGSARGIMKLMEPRRGILFAGMPASGKTTLLRDAIRTVASGESGHGMLKVAVADERYELSAASGGVPAYDLGICSDVICGQCKAEAIEQAVRTLSPDIIACDEIGSAAEIAALDAGLCCGVAFFATVHCGGKNELFASARIRRLMDTGAFGYLVLLDTPRFPGRASLLFTMEDYYAKACGTAATV